MTLDYIRNAYGVPAKLGGRVCYTGDRGREQFGTIKGARSGHINIRLDGSKFAQPFHPTWMLEYLADAPLEASPRQVVQPIRDESILPPGEGEGE